MMKSKFRRIFLLFLFICSAALVVVWIGNSVFIPFESDAPSRSVGTLGWGTLENGKRLPTSGANYRAYSRICTLLGRNSVHSVIREVILEAYAQLEENDPDLTFVYGETGWPSGGPFPPHITHQNGLSVDFMVPVRDSQGNAVPLPTSIWTRFGSDLEFDVNGRLGDLQIDFEALAKHLDALHQAAGSHGIWIKVVILTPEYLPLLWKTPTGSSLQGKFPFWRKPAKVRHDEHYHIDFSNPAG
jgi:penicillin-insensitive murein endopeptidase